MADYVYLHEKVDINYSVKVNPAPADEATATFHKGARDGPEFHTEPAKLTGEGSLKLAPADHGLTVQDSPVWIHFVFKKAKAKPPEQDRWCAVALAEPAVAKIEGAPEAKPGDNVEKRQVIGKTGETGFAGGDHLHYGVYLAGVAVLPVEWWDAKWIDDNVAPKLEGQAASASAPSPSSRPPQPRRAAERQASPRPSSKPRRRS